MPQVNRRCLLRWEIKTSNTTSQQLLHDFLFSCSLSFLVRFVRGKCAKCPLHFRINELETVDVTGIDPAKATKQILVSRRPNNRFARLSDLPFFSNTLEV
jgi:hypothetical protein